MESLLMQILIAVKGQQYFIALFPTLTLPDICGAIDAVDGRATGARYMAWFDKYVGHKYRDADGEPTLTGEVCYYYRCSLLHQGRSAHPKSKFTRVIFVPSKTVTGWSVHNNVLVGVLQIDIEQFCLDVSDGVKQWLRDVRGTDLFKRNYEEFIRYRPNGLPGHLEGVPVFG